MFLLLLASAHALPWVQPTRFPDALSPFRNVCEGAGEHCFASHASDALLYGSMGIAVSTAGIFTVAGYDRDRAAAAPLAGTLLGVGGSFGTYYLVSRWAQRPRPYSYAEDELTYPRHVQDDDHYSFYSGHTSTTAASLFAAAATLDYELPRGEQRGARWAAYGIATAGTVVVGGLRVAGGYHFVTDVATGAVVGAGFGLLGPYVVRHGPFQGSWLPADGERRPAMVSLGGDW